MHKRTSKLAEWTLTYIGVIKKYFHYEIITIMIRVQFMLIFGNIGTKDLSSTFFVNK